MTYRYVQGLDYGLRSGTLGLSFHMSEGGDGLVDSFLARKPGETRTQWASRVNGVSCHVCILSTGETIQMLGWNRICGNLDPNHRAGEYGYYGHHHLVDVLGNGWTDPNRWTLSVEIAGKRAIGPTRAQVESAVKWGLEMKAMFPTLRGATGHHDQSTKECPGLMPNMKEIFTRVGGHGLWPTIPVPKEPTVPDAFNIPRVPTLIELPAGTVVYDNDALQPSPQNYTISPAPKEFDFVGSHADGRQIIAYQPTGATVEHSYWVKPNVGTKREAPPPPPVIPDCTPAANKAANDAIDRVRDALPAVLQGARP